MEKVREVVMRKGTTRFFSPQSQKRQLNKQSSLINGGGEDADVSERSKKDKFTGGGSQEEEEEEMELCSSLPLITGSSGKRFKLHSKPLSDCNAVDHASIPRKLRSVMSKRSRESLSPPLPDGKKHHHKNANGTERLQINGAKKSKQKMVSHIGLVTSSQITKDEEEVVETLYALAKMSPNNKSDTSRIDQPISKGKSSPLSETTESPVLASKVPKEVIPTSIRAEATNLSSVVVDESARYEVKAKSFTESSVLDRATISANQKTELPMYSSTSLPDPKRTSLLSNTADTHDTQTSIAAKSPIPSDLGRRSTQATQHGASFSDQKPELLPVAAVVMKQERQPVIKESKDSDAGLTCIEGTLSLWPRLSVVVSGGSEVPRSSATKAPACLDSATSGAKPSLVGTDISEEKVNPVTVDSKRSLKKCATHVYLSRLILVYQASEKNPMFSAASVQLKPNEGGTKLGTTEANNLIGLNSGFNGLIPIDFRNGRNGVIAISGINGSATGKSMNEVRTGIAKDKRLQANRQQPSMILTSEKQSCDFLSLSVSTGGLESATPNIDINQGKNGLESSAQVRVPYLHPTVQNLQLMPFPFHSHSTSSTTYTDQLAVAAAQQLHLPQHMSGGPFCGQQNLIHAGSARQHQKIWAAHYMPGGNLSSHLSKWQNGKSQYDSPLLISCAQPLTSSSSLSQEVFSAKFPPNAQPTASAATLCSPFTITPPFQREEAATASSFPWCL